MIKHASSLLILRTLSLFSVPTPWGREDRCMHPGLEGVKNMTTLVVIVRMSGARGCDLNERTISLNPLDSIS